MPWFLEAARVEFYSRGTWRKSGQRVVVVERRYIGGSCPNIACMPSKNEIWRARIAYLVRHAAQFGTITGPVTTDMVKVRQRKIAKNASSHKGNRIAQTASDGLKTPLPPQTQDSPGTNDSIFCQLAATH